MRALAILGAFLLTVAAADAATLSRGTAERALQRRLERYQGFTSVHATCRASTSTTQRCTWRGRRSGGSWRGRAVVRRLAGGSLDVRITSAHHVAR
jgi:hypothetical protein